MKFVVQNIDTEVKHGGKDNLIKADIDKELKKYLSVKVKNSYWASKGKKGWDGTKSFYSRGKFPTGFLVQVYNFCIDLGYHIEIIDERDNMPKFLFGFDGDPRMHNEFYTHEGDAWSMTGKYDYQAGFINAARNYVELSGKPLYFPRGIYDAATNAGKNLLTLGILANIDEPRCLFLLHSSDIYNQAVEFFNSFFPFKVGEIKSGKYNLEPFTIGMVKSLKSAMGRSINVEKDMKTYFNTLIVDEAHRSGGKEYSNVVRSINAGARYFISGTPLESKDDVKNLVILGISGPILGSISNKELQDRGVSMKFVLNILLSSPSMPGMILSYREAEEKLIMLCPSRRDQIVKEAKNREGKQILICVREKKHAYYLAEGLEEAFPQDVRVVHSDHPGRYNNIEDFKKGKYSVLVTSYIMKEGLNIPKIDVLILAMGGMDAITLKQFIGRLVRDDGSGNVLEVIDFYDAVTKWLIKHSNYRLRKYTKEQFDIVYHYEHTKTGRPKRSEIKKDS